MRPRLAFCAIASLLLGLVVAAGIALVALPPSHTDITQTLCSIDAAKMARRFACEPVCVACASSSTSDPLCSDMAQDARNDYDVDLCEAAGWWPSVACPPQQGAQCDGGPTCCLRTCLSWCAGCLLWSCARECCAWDEDMVTCANVTLHTLCTLKCDVAYTWEMVLTFRVGDEWYTQILPVALGTDPTAALAYASTHAPTASMDTPCFYNTTTNPTVLGLGAAPSPSSGEMTYRVAFAFCAAVAVACIVAAVLYVWRDR